jgi:phage gpG-like protein
MQEFENLAAFAAHLAALEAGIATQLEKGLDHAAAHVQKTARDEIGHYQNAAGPFPKWAELTDGTKEDRVRKGFTENDPGLRSGAMRESIERQRQGLEAAVGSNDDHLVFFEMGTKTAPPRPVLGLAAHYEREAVGEIITGAVIRALSGRS